MVPRQTALDPDTRSSENSEIETCQIGQGGGAEVKVWIVPTSRLIDEALATLLSSEGFAVLIGSTTGVHLPDAAIWNLRDRSPPYPRPPDIPTLALAEGADSDKMCLLLAGYRGYLNAAGGRTEFRRAVETVLRGGIWAERHILERFVLGSGLPTLTPREHQILSLVVQGLTNKQIAKRLDLSHKTVKVHVSNVLGKHRAKNRIELVAHHASKVLNERTL